MDILILKAVAITADYYQCFLILSLTTVSSALALPQYFWHPYGQWLFEGF